MFQSEPTVCPHLVRSVDTLGLTHRIVLGAVFLVAFTAAAGTLKLLTVTSFLVPFTNINN